MYTVVGCLQILAQQLRESLFVFNYEDGFTGV
jgi:hypothetical protein